MLLDPVDSPEILDDLELPKDEAVDIKDMEVNKRKLTRRINQVKVFISLPLPNSSFLVMLYIYIRTWICIFVPTCRLSFEIRVAKERNFLFWILITLSSITAPPLRTLFSSWDLVIFAPFLFSAFYFSLDQCIELA